MKTVSLYGHWQGTFVLANAILLKLSFFYLNVFPNIGAQAGWIIAIYTSLIYLLVILGIKFIYKRIEPIDLLEIANRTFGKTGQLIVGFLLVLCFLIYTSSNLIYFIDTFRNSLLPNTPFKTLLYMLIIASVFLASKGIETITRAHAFFVPITVVITVFIMFFMTGKGDINNLFPIMGTGPKSIFLEGLFALSGFYEIIFLFFIIPDLQKFEEINKTIKLTYIMTSTIMVALTFVYIIAVPYPANTTIVSVIMMVTDNITFISPFQEIFTVLSITYCLCTMLYVSLNLYFITQIISRLFNIKKTFPILMYVAIIMCGLTLFPKTVIANRKIYEVAIMSLWFFGLVMPLIIIFTYYFKVKKEKGKVLNEKKK